MEPPILVNEKITELYGWTVRSLSAPVPENDYGLKWPDGTLQYFKELYGFVEGGLDERNKFYHMVNMIKLDLPSFEFVSRGYINSAGLKVLKACCEQTDLAVSGSGSAGKTFPVGAYILESWKASPHATLSFVCTTSLGAAEDRIWGAIVRMFQTSIYKIGTYVPHKHVITFGNFSESASDRDFSAAIKALAIEKGEEGKKAIDITRGRKQLHVKLVFDELPEMEAYVMDAAVNLESNPDLQVIGIGNPAKETDAHGQMCKPDHPLGYKSITKNTPEWKTRTGWAVFLNGEWSPNFEAPPGEPIPFPRLTNRETLRKMLVRCHGNINSLLYWRNAVGFWPPLSVDHTVLTEELLESHRSHEKAEWRSLTRKSVCGFDAGFTLGGDSCVAQFGEVGTNLDGRKIVAWKAQKVYLPEINSDFEESIAKQVVDDCIYYKVEPDGFGMDISGDGGKIMRAIIRYWLHAKENNRAADIFPISSMGRPSPRLVSNVDPRPAHDVYDRRVTEYWMMVQEAVLCELIREMPKVSENGNSTHPLIEQLCSRMYYIKGKKFSIETKDEMKERTQGRSPDEADGFVYMIEMAKRHGLVFQTPSDITRQKFKKTEHPPSRQLVGTYSSSSWGEDDD